MILNKDAVLYEDQELIVCYKSAGTAVQTAKIGEPDMVSLVQNYLKVPYVGVIHRLDQPVEGILVLAKTQSAAADLSRQFSDKDKVEKRYYALVCEETVRAGEAEEKIYRLTDYLVKDGRSNTSKVVAPEVKDAKKAELEYKISGRVPANECIISLADILLKTGRHHQIRVQMSHAGMPLLGDLKYGNEKSIKTGRERKIKDIALCAYCLSFLHPVTKKPLHFEIIPQNPAFIPFLPVTP